MKIEEEIKQGKPFKSEVQKLLINLNFTSSWLNSLFSKHLKEFGITPHQFNVLRILNGRFPEGYCNHQITERMIDRSSNSTRIVDKLVEKKLAVKYEGSEDRRAVDVRITPSGRTLLAAIEKSQMMNKSKLLQFNEEKARIMNEWLDELRS